MTVISAIIKKDFIIVASDSLIQRSKENNQIEKIFSSHPKFAAFPQIRCVVSYWGHVSIIEKGRDTPSWDIKKWLIEKQKNQIHFKSVEEFGALLTKELTAIFQRYTWDDYKENKKTLGIHLVGFEWFQNKWIPELFLIIGDSNNWNFNFSRRTYGDLKNWENMEDDIIIQRETYYNVLEKGYSVYNNGDNEMFNHFFNSFHGAIKSTSAKKKLKNVSTSGELPKEYFLDLATLPIKQIANFQKKYYHKKDISIGGKIHAILMNSEGIIIR